MTARTREKFAQIGELQHGEEIAFWRYTPKSEYPAVGDYAITATVDETEDGGKPDHLRIFIGLHRVEIQNLIQELTEALESET